MFRPTTLRTAAFTRSADGYNPDEVEAFLDDVATALEDGAAVQELIARLMDADFSTSAHGYSPFQVRGFLNRVATELAVGDAGSLADTADDPSAAVAQDVDDDDDAVDIEGLSHVDAEIDDQAEPAAATDDLAPAHGDAEDDPGAGTPVGAEPVAYGDESGTEDNVVTHSEHTFEPLEEVREVPRSLDTLVGAIDRTKVTITNLESFVMNEVAAVKASCERQIDETTRQCEEVLADARAVAEDHIGAAERRAADIVAAAEAEREALRQETAGEMEQRRSEFEDEMVARSAEAERRASALIAGAEAQAAEITREAELRRQEADQLVDNATRLKAMILASIEEAREVLVPGAEA